MKKILSAFAANTVFANVMLFMIILSGLMAVKFMIRETFPGFSLDMIAITVPYPGADPEEVEEGISRKIEEAIEGLEGIKQYTTKSSEGVATAQIEVKEDYDVNEVLDRVRAKVDSISTFPVDAEKPVITEILIKDSVVLLSLSGDMPEKRLKEWGRKIKDEFQQIPKISQVTLFGIRDYEISIEVSEQRLLEYGLTFDKVVSAIRKSNINMGGGTIRTKGEEIRIRTMGRKYTGKELAKIVVIARPDGEIITLDKIAKIHDGFTEDPIMATVDGKPAVLIHIMKTDEEDSLIISKIVHDFVEKRQKILPQGVYIKILFDATDMLRARIDLLTKNGIIGLCLVFILLWMFLDFRLSFWAGMGIPISLCGGMVILWIMGETINMISLFGMIMVLGIVVDDAIVVGESIYVQREKGEKPLDAAVKGVIEVGMPVVAAVITTIVAFLPLGFIGGIMGKFISILPVVVISCLTISLLECLLLLPAHLSHLPDPSVQKEKKGFFIFNLLNSFNEKMGKGLKWFVGHIYLPALKRTLRWRYISFCCAIALLFLSIGLIKGGFIKFLVFPDLDGFIITANVEFPNGTPPQVVKDAVDQVESAIIRVSEKTKTKSGEPLLLSRMAIIGQSLGEMSQTGPNLGGMYAILLPSERRGIHSKKIEVMWENEVGTIPGIKSLTFHGMQAGPPGAPIEIWVQGDDMDKILMAAHDLINRLHEFAGVYQIRSDFSPGKRELRLELKPQARVLGLTTLDLARQVNAGFYGQEALRIQRGRDDIRIKVRYTAKERSRISDFERIKIRTPAGYEVPLISVANIKFEPGYSTITRTDGMRRVAVSAEVDTHNANTEEIITELAKTFFPNLKKKYPGLYISVQGEKKKMRESFSSLYVGFPLAMIGIFIIIATMFRSYAQPFVIMFTVPFGIIGAILAHLFMGFNLSLMSVFGMVALTGVVVNDAIVLIERVNENLAQGMPFFKAIEMGGVRRFRAIILTTLSTVGGLLPLISETDMQARFLIPMALSLAGGVAFATLLTLILIPSLMAILNDLRCLIFWLKYGIWPRRTQVEPGAYRFLEHGTSFVNGTGKYEKVSN